MQGPTVVLKILEYALIRDVQSSLRHPRRPDAAFLHPPLTVLQGFGSAQHMKLTGVLFQNMFPAINVSKAKLSDCQVWLQNSSSCQMGAHKVTSNTSMACARPSTPSLPCTHCGTMRSHSAQRTMHNQLLTTSELRKAGLSSVMETKAPGIL
jgi:hypothetical protein